MARKLIVEIIGDSTSYQRSIAKSEQANRRFAESTKALGASMLRIGRDAAIVGGVIGVLASRQFSEFESSMQKIVGLVGVNEKQVHAWSDQLLELGTEVAKSPKELADALFFVTSAGFRGQKAMEALSVSAHASAAGLGDTKVVADAVTSAVNSYGAASLSAAQSADILTATVREGKTAADALAPVIGNIAPLAADLGVSFDQVGAAIAGMTRVGTPAMKAATGLRSVFSTLLKPQQRSVEAFKKQGLNIDTLRETLGKRNGLLIVLDQVKKAFGGNTKAMAQAFPNVKALTTVLSLVGKNADAVRGIFERMTKSTGSVNRAFAAISEDEGFQFERTLQALRAAGIRLGAILEPLANLVARGLTAAFKRISQFFKDFDEAKTVRAKLEVIWEGVKGATDKAQDLLTRAVDAIDWNAVFAGAGGLADALEARIKEVDWTAVGRQMGAGFKKAGDFVGPALQNLGTFISKAMHDLDWEAIGLAAGPGFVTMILSAFDALFDPGFWIRNWQLALSVAIDALGLLFPEVFGLEKLGALFIKPFARALAPMGARLAAGFGEVFARAGSALVDAAGRVSERLASALAKDLILLPRTLGSIFDRTIGALIRKVGAKFEKLGGLARFTIRLLGIAAVIRTIERLVHKVGEIFGDLRSTISSAWNRLWNFLERRALRAALLIIEPLTHIPRWLGGGTFQDLKTKWQGTLKTMESDTDASTKRVQGSFDKNLKGKTVTINTVYTSTFVGPVPPGATTTASSAAAAGQRSINDRAQATVKRNTQTAVDTANDAGTGSNDAANAAKRATKQAEKAKTAFENLMDALSLKLDIATATRGFKDDIKVLHAINDAIVARIKVVGKTTDLARQLFENQQQLKDVARQAKQADIFKELGLTAEGQKPVASAGALLKRAKSMLAGLKGTALDTKKNRQELRTIVRVLKQNFKSAGRDIRQAILDMLNEIAGATTEAATGPLTKTHGLNTKKIIEGLGLSDEEARAIRQRLSRFNSAGRTPAGSGTRSTSGNFVDDRPIVVNTTINLDGHKVATNTTRHQQKGRRRNPPQKRGPNRSEHGGR